MTVYFLVPVCRYHLMYILYNLFYCVFNMHIITGKDKLNIKLNKYGQLMYGKKVSIYLLCLILMSMSSYKPNLNCLSSDVLPYMHNCRTTQSQIYWNHASFSFVHDFVL